jgi:hypothetical protein
MSLVLQAPTFHSIGILSELLNSPGRVRMDPGEFSNIDTGQRLETRKTALVLTSPSISCSRSIYREQSHLDTATPKFIVINPWIGRIQHSIVLILQIASITTYLLRCKLVEILVKFAETPNWSVIADG